MMSEPPYLCHSERSEESGWPQRIAPDGRDAESDPILRYANLAVQDDTSGRWVTRPSFTCRQLVGLVAVLVLAVGCDFTPVLDIPLPDHEKRIVMHAVLIADSTVSARVGVSENPYTNRDAEQYEESRRLLATATVELVQNGQVVEMLTRALCVDYIDQPEPYPGENPFQDDERCGPFISETQTLAGSMYTLRARMEGLPEATATVTIPQRVEVSDVEAVGESRLSFSLRDPAGLGEHYALQLSPISFEYENTYQICQPPDYRTGCRDTTVVERYSNSRRFSTNDPFLLASARVPGTEPVTLIAFDDRTFDGTERAFTLEPEQFYRPGRFNLHGSGVEQNQASEDVLWIVALDAKMYDAYQATYFSLGDDNPFEEPSNLPSNVVDGYGLVGAATIHARALPESSARLARRR